MGCMLGLLVPVWDPSLLAAVGLVPLPREQGMASLALSSGAALGTLERVADCVQPTGDELGMNWG